jgi:hypothetical protein
MPKSRKPLAFLALRLFVVAAVATTTMMVAALVDVAVTELAALLG